MSRFIQPPKDQLHKLRRPLTNGEMKVFQFFDKHLHKSWEIYIEPHLNGLRPDFVLLHPKAGIAVFEIKDWNLETLKIRFEYLKDHEPTLVGEKNGKIFPLPNPIDKIFQYKEEIFDLYWGDLGT
jgi:hypothetical protein